MDNYRKIAQCNGTGVIMNYKPLETNSSHHFIVRERCGTYDSYTQELGSESNDIVKFQSNTATSGVTEDYSPYIFVLPSNFNILREVNSIIAKIHNPNVKKNIDEFINILQGVLLEVRHSISNSSNLPPLKFRLHEDDSVLIEWIFNDFRIGFSIEPNNDDSGWYLVSNDNLNEESKSGHLKLELLAPLFTKLLTFALSNS
jgi:hypothetical protein